MKKINLFIFTLISILSLDLLSQNYVFKEDFNDNQNSWDISDMKIVRAGIENGMYTFWNGSEYLERQVCKAEFNTELSHTITIKLANLNNESDKIYYKYYLDRDGNPKQLKETESSPFWGIVWGFKDKNNYHSIVFNSPSNDYGKRELQYAIISYVSGSEIIHKGFSKVYDSYNFNSTTGFNTINIVKKGDENLIYGGGGSSTYLGKCDLTDWYGPNLGLMAGPGAEIVTDYIYIKSNSYEDNKPSKIDAQATTWTTEELKRRLAITNPDEVEGIWEDFDSKIDVYKMDYGSNNKFGIVKSGEGYDLIYLAGSSKFQNSWNEGDLKGRITKTGTSGLMKVEWFNTDMTVDNSVYLYLSDGNLLNISFKNKNSSVKMLKLFPIEEMPSISASVDSPTEVKSTGSGIFINKDGFIVTNYHVIEDANSITVQYTSLGKTIELDAEVLVSDKTNDLSILQIRDVSFKPLIGIKFGIKSISCDVGTNVFTMGYPMSNSLGDEVKVTDGIISAKTGFQGDIVTYQISAPIQPGNSGGPLFDKQGNLVGIINAKIPSAENIGYAIKISYLNNLIDVAPSVITVPSNNAISTLSFTEKIKVLSQYVVLIKVK